MVNRVVFGGAGLRMPRPVALPTQYRGPVDELPAPMTGMTISIRTRQDVVIVDPERFVASARAAYRETSPEITEERAAEHIRNVYDAVWALVDRFGRLAADARHPPGSPATGFRTARTDSHLRASVCRSC
ncbi:hypothetical protein ACFQ0T_02875 [Kitasatospora gansuensis]